MARIILLSQFPEDVLGSFSAAHVSITHRRRRFFIPLKVAKTAARSQQ